MAVRVTCRKYVDLDLEFNNQKFIEVFYVFETKSSKLTLLGRSALNRNIENSKNPIECEINTRSDTPVSWTRKIRSYQDKMDFLKLVREL
jgi:hypothetical protein